MGWISCGASDILNCINACCHNFFPKSLMAHPNLITFLSEMCYGCIRQRQQYYLKGSSVKGFISYVREHLIKFHYLLLSVCSCHAIQESISQSCIIHAVFLVQTQIAFLLRFLPAVNAGAYLSNALAQVGNTAKHNFLLTPKVRQTWKAQVGFLWEESNKYIQFLEQDFTAHIFKLKEIHLSIFCRLSEVAGAAA